MFGKCPFQATAQTDGTTTIYLQSISAMPLAMSHEETRVLDYSFHDSDRVGETRSGPFQVTCRLDGADSILLHSIAAMPLYEQQSHEEIRCADYFGSISDAPVGRLFDPNGTRQGVCVHDGMGKVYLQSISALEHSHEELRLADNTKGIRGAATSLSSINLDVPSTSDNIVASQPTIPTGQNRSTLVAPAFQSSVPSPNTWSFGFSSAPALGSAPFTGTFGSTNIPVASGSNGNEASSSSGSAALSSDSNATLAPGRPFGTSDTNAPGIVPSSGSALGSPNTWSFGSSSAPVVSSAPFTFGSTNIPVASSSNGNEAPSSTATASLPSDSNATLAPGRSFGTSDTNAPGIVPSSGSALGSPIVWSFGSSSAPFVSSVPFTFGSTNIPVASSSNGKEAPSSSATASSPSASNATLALGRSFGTSDTNAKVPPGESVPASVENRCTIWSPGFSSSASVIGSVPMFTFGSTSIPVASSSGTNATSMSSESLVASDTSAPYRAPQDDSVPSPGLARASNEQRLVAAPLFGGNVSSVASNSCPERRLRRRRQALRDKCGRRSSAPPQIALVGSSDLSRPRPIASTIGQQVDASGPGYEYYLHVLGIGAKPKLTKKGYEVSPTIEALSKLPHESLASVADVVVKRPGYGKVEWDGAVDLSGANLDNIVVIERESIALYGMDDANGVMPPVGTKLNGPMILTFFVVFPDESQDANAFVERIEQATQRMGAEFISYDGDAGVWKIRASRAGLYSLNAPRQNRSMLHTPMRTYKNATIRTKEPLQPTSVSVFNAAEVGDTSREAEQAVKALTAAINKVTLTTSKSKSSD